ncbi:hypothetical protein Sjap_002545 [Stephania japonica]|uniref:Uncharacterized protein n=1 Tax=Stephania japonica TaxID=461633 RepID=A0AAP0PU93_9MAGN
MLAGAGDPSTRPTRRPAVVEVAVGKWGGHKPPDPPYGLHGVPSMAPHDLYDSGGKAAAALHWCHHVMSPPFTGCT